MLSSGVISLKKVLYFCSPYLHLTLFFKKCSYIVLKAFLWVYHSGYINRFKSTVIEILCHISIPFTTLLGEFVSHFRSKLDYEILKLWDEIIVSGCKVKNMDMELNFMRVTSCIIAVSATGTEVTANWDGYGCIPSIYALIKPAYIFWSSLHSDSGLVFYCDW